MANKAALILVIIIGLIAILGCGQLAKLRNDEPKIVRDEPSKDSPLIGKDWKSFDLKETDIKVDLPGEPKDRTPPMPASYKTVFSAMHIYSYDEKGLDSSYSELVPTGKKTFTIKELAETSMTALKKQIPSLTYDLDIQSDTNAKYNGTFTRNGKTYDVRGCCIYKKTKPSRVWAVMTLAPQDNPDAQQAGQRIINSVVFKDSDEVCK